MNIQVISDISELDGAIELSRSHNEIITVQVPEMKEACEYLEAHYECDRAQDCRGGTAGMDVWSLGGDWRLFVCGQ